MPRPRWRMLGVAFAAGAAAAAAVAFVATRGDSTTGAAMPLPPFASAQVEASPNADLEREVVHDGSGHLADLVRAGDITYEVALGAATRPSDFALKFKVLERGVAAPALPTPEAAAAGAGTGLQGGSGFDFLNG